MKGKPKNFFENHNQVIVVLLLPALFLYMRSLSFGFTSMDEQWMIMNNTTFLENWSSITFAFTEPTTDLYYRPLFMTSLVVDYHLGKLNPFVYHFSNLLWHLLSVYLTFKFLISMSVSSKTAFGLTLLFSIHPVALQAVAWVPGRNDLMLCTFSLASILFLKTYLATKKIAPLMLHLLLYLCALFTKESGVVLPLIFLLCMWVFKSKNLRLKDSRILFAWMGLLAFWMFLRSSIIQFELATPNSFLTDLKNCMAGYLVFIGKTIYPFQQSVMPTLSNTSLIPGMVTLALLALLCARPGLNDKKIALSGILIFIILLIIPVWFGASKSGGEHYEQRIYGAMPGLLLFVSQVKFNLRSKTATYIFVFFGVVYGLKTISRMQVYKNELTFINAGVKECPTFYLFHLQKADLLNDPGQDIKEALIHYDKAIQLRPDYPQSFANRGSAYFKLRRYREAIDDFSWAIDHSAYLDAYYFNRCMSYLRLGNFEEAMKDMIVLKKHASTSLSPENEKKIMDGWINNLDAVRKQLQQDQNNAGLCYKIATLYFDIEMNPEAMTYLKQAVFLDPTNQLYKERLAKAEKQK